MARYMGSVRGSRGEATRLGTPASGLTVKANGWRLGVTVEMSPNEAHNGDQVTVYVTSGSAGDGVRVLLGTYSRAWLDRDEERAIEDIRLMAAAPDLLAALSGLCGAADPFTRSPRPVDGEVLAAGLAQARALVASLAGTVAK